MGCGAKAPQDTLLRFAEAGGRAVPDPGRSLPGRGAWLHPSAGCLALAERRNAFARAFRTRIEGIDSNELPWQRNASTS